jgi:hypothetical protein
MENMAKVLDLSKGVMALPWHQIRAFLTCAIIDKILREQIQTFSLKERNGHLF